MESIDISVRAMKEVNRKLAQFADALQRTSPSLTAAQMAEVLAEIVQMGEWTHAGCTQKSDARLAEELERYRRLLEQLRQALPVLHTRLLTERSRLQAESAHLDASAAWARSASQQTR